MTVQIDMLPGDPPKRKRSEKQRAERALAERLLADLATKPPGEPSAWAAHPIKYEPDTARVVTSRINKNGRQELPGDKFESTCIEGIVYVRARAQAQK
jgi:hypothetical protein